MKHNLFISVHIYFVFYFTFSYFSTESFPLAGFSFSLDGCLLICENTPTPPTQPRPLMEKKGEAGWEGLGCPPMWL